MRTKIVATIGPVSESAEMLEKLVEAGLDIARMNFSHCSHDEYRARVGLLKAAGEKIGKQVRILQDLQGPRIRVGVLPPEGRVLAKDELVTFSTNGVSDNDPDTPVGASIHVDDPYLHADIKPGEPIYLANGELELVAEKIEGTKIFARVLRGGTLYSRKGVNVPHTLLTTSGPTEKDLEDAKFGASEGVDLIGISFVQTAADVEKVRAVVGTGPTAPKLIAKIETGVGITHIDEIVKASDGIMIARGDLGIEVPLEQVPYMQKHMISLAAWQGKGSITATQMLYSMIASPRPTRAEVSDIANAVWDGTDAVMLSDETASGKYPLEALQTMVRIVKAAEKVGISRPNPLEVPALHSFSEAV